MLFFKHIAIAKRVALYITIELASFCTLIFVALADIKHFWSHGVFGLAYHCFLL